MFTELSQLLLDWYHKNARNLPWRNHPDPYAIWISEIMLQQTRVESVIPYFNRWIQNFPNISSLAKADQQEVLKLWEGLGYYSRARNLHNAAKIILDSFGSIMPDDPKLLESLPGIGKYTSRAIASMAFGKDYATLDGNIRRVLSRVFNLEIPARSPEGEKKLWQFAEENLPPGRAGDYNQAIMDLGASYCSPRNPRCMICPIHKLCQAYSLGLQEQRPIMPHKEQIPHYVVTAAIIIRDGKVLIAQRPNSGLLGGMWEFPGGKMNDGETLVQCLEREIKEELDCNISVGEEFGVYQHAFTHFRITLHAFLCIVVNGVPSPIEANQIAWVKSSDLSNYPMGKVDRQISQRLAKKPLFDSL
ncbi:MAG: A/G-specific adenine glycosylase [Anaerolineaceae bacterium]